ncbi:MAG: hypothetical protein LBH14_08545 [Desulfobulbaceae bacterium]|jgi:cell division protein FtsL|nr:hypothetical protein [Desulfobulbaceae bacterium]
MSIRHLALALYQSMKEVARLEKEIAEAQPARKSLLAEELRRERANLQAVRRLLDGAKEEGH